MDAVMSELPTGTVTLLLADVEGSTRLWETQPDAMKVAVERLDQTLSDAVTAHHGVRPVEQGEGDSFVIAFARAADAVGCALELPARPVGARSSCASACTPATCNCAMKATTSDRRSTAPPGSATLPMAARRCSRVRLNRLSSTNSQTVLRSPTSAPIRCAIYPAPNALCSSATPTYATTSLPYGLRTRLPHTTCRSN